MFEIELAAALLGAIVACQNWRLAPDELRHCIDLVEPKLVIASAETRFIAGEPSEGRRISSSVLISNPL